MITGFKNSMITGFKNGAYIKLNTPEIREYLEFLGYKRNNSFGEKEGTCILTYPYFREDCPDEIYPHYIVCDERYFQGLNSWIADRVNCEQDIEKFFNVVSEKI